MTYLRFCLLVLAPACGLIDSDVTNFDLTLPDKTFSVDAAGWNLDETATDTFLSMGCTAGPQNVCTAAVMQACPMNCTGECSATTNQCELQLNISAYKSIDLVTEKPELNQINDKPVIKVTVDSIAYAVTSNTLNVATPELGVYVAPITVMDPKDPMATQIGIIPSVPAGGTVTTRDMMYTPSGKQALVDTMSTFKTPFNIIVGTSKDNPIVVEAGDDIPVGKLDAVIQIKAHAGL